MKMLEGPPLASQTYGTVWECMAMYGIVCIYMHVWRQAPLPIAMRSARLPDLGARLPHQGLQRLCFH
jgi:hypothetical protein